MTDIAATLQRAVAALWRPRHASYRLQLGRSLTVDQVAAVGPYLFALGPVVLLEREGPEGPLNHGQSHSRMII